MVRVVPRISLMQDRSARQAYSFPEISANEGSQRRSEMLVAKIGAGLGLTGQRGFAHPSVQPD